MNVAGNLLDALNATFQCKIWNSLPAAEVYYDKNLANAYGVAVNHQNWENITASGEGLINQSYILIGPDILKSDAISALGLALHEGIHDMFNKISHDVQGQNSVALQADKAIQPDIALAVANRLYESVPLSAFPALYLTDFEEALCNHAESVFELTCSPTLVRHHVESRQVYRRAPIARQF